MQRRFEDARKKLSADLDTKLSQRDQLIEQHQEKKERAARGQEPDDDLDDGEGDDGEVDDPGDVAMEDNLGGADDDADMFVIRDLAGVGRGADDMDVVPDGPA